MKREQLLARLRSTSRRDIVIVGLSALLLVAGGFWGAAQFIRPAPPRQMVIATGWAGGAYQRYAAEYKQFFDKFGIQLIERPTSGSIENAKLLRDDSQSVDAAFIQGGTTESVEGDGLTSLGALYYEPLWIHPSEAAPRGIADGDVVKIFNERGAVLAASIARRYASRDSADLPNPSNAWP